MALAQGFEPAIEKSGTLGVNSVRIVAHLDTSSVAKECTLTSRQLVEVISLTRLCLAEGLKKVTNHLLPTGSHSCQCEKVRHASKLVVLTGGPGGGKTAVLEMARRYFCQHVAIAPEAASIVFGGGFPRSNTPEGRRAAQRAIFQVQRALETVALEGRQSAVILCDRGTLDGLAYWPGSRQSFFEEFDINFEEELSRYSAVVHVEVPALAWGYEKNRIRRESVSQARKIDHRIAQAWSGHPRVMTVGAEAGFLDKLAYAIELLRGELPACCQTHLHAVPEKTN